ncbi:MAG TPA: hypothetical protein PKD53_08510 [Chloroflexaceae bacterium]|nr:hypothetical protein [Chloroflexaceae bacterium]
MLYTASLLVGALLGALLTAFVILPRVRLILDELQLARRERDRLQTELIARRSEASHARAQVAHAQQDLLAFRRRVAAITAERDEARVAQAGADAAYREILAERDRLKGELALARRRRALP